MAGIQIKITDFGAADEAETLAGSGVQQTKTISVLGNRGLLEPPATGAMTQRSEDPLNTFISPLIKHSNIPNELHAFFDASTETFILGEKVCAGLQAYVRALGEDEHDDMTDEFIEGETARLQVVNQKLTMKTNSLRSVADLLRTCDHTQYDDTVVNPGSADGTRFVVADGFVKQVQDVSDYVNKARAYLVSSHVFYKVNYALCPVENQRRRS